MGTCSTCGCAYYRSEYSGKCARCGEKPRSVEESISLRLDKAAHSDVPGDRVDPSEETLERYLRRTLKPPRIGSAAFNPSWETRRRIFVSDVTIARLNSLAVDLCVRTDLAISPLRLAAAILERAVEGETK